MKAIELIDNLRTNFDSANSQLADKTDRHIMYMLDEARAKLAAQKMDAKVNVVQMSQVLDITPTSADKANVGSIGKSKVLSLTIPDPIAYSNGGGIFTVGPTDGTTSYTQISYSQIRTALYRKYTGTAPKWFLLDNKIYVINPPAEAVAKIRIRGIFDEPWRVEKAMGRRKELSPFDFEYPLTLKDADTIYKLASSGDLGWGDTAVQSVVTARNKQSKDNQLLDALKNIGSAKV